MFSAFLACIFTIPKYHTSILNFVRLYKMATTRKCGKGQIRRVSFTRRSKSGKISRIRSRCVRNLGLPGKGVQRIGTLKKGLLSKYGYASQKNIADRHAALKKAVDAYGALSVLRKLNAVAIYTRRTSPAISAIFKADMKWVRSSFEFKTNK
jgi:hypothetical protein